MSDEETFADHFSSNADGYRAHRPGYPSALFKWLATLPSKRETAWDCGCGSGQATIGLAPHFDEVIGTDPSAEQIRNAKAASGGVENVRYAVAPAEASGLDAGSVDLTLAAQAAHWFDQNAFHAEVRRVAAPGAVLALLTYGPFTAKGSLGEVLTEIYEGPVSAYWPPERRHVETGYGTLPFPFEEIEPPSFEMSARWSRDRLVGYIGTWSAIKAYRAERDDDPMPEIEERIARIWSDPFEEHNIAWPLSIRAGKV